MKKLPFLTLALALIFVVAACNSEGTDQDASDGVATAVVATDAQVTPTAIPGEEPTVPTGPLTTLNFAETVFDFGDVPDGESVSHTYRFTNTGKEPLVISNARGSCGCTVPKWPRTPIPPGEGGEIVVEFNTKGKPGRQSKKVTITANTDPAQTFLTISGNVLKVEDTPQ